MKELKRILIVNRGEISARIARTVKRMGLTPIIAYSEADRFTLAVKENEEAHLLGPAAAGDSYLNVEAVLKLAKSTGADAIHPGYGFLSENSDFARRTAQAGLLWIGPSPEAMEMVSSKSKAKDLADREGVPTLPGFRGEQNVQRFVAEAEKIGYPVLLKAAAGGGGRGIRKVQNASELQEQFPRASLEAKNSFGDGELLLEKYLEEARHIEIQIFGDTSGQVVHLGERDCSVQRRHQKLIEESPSPGLKPEWREKMAAAAVKLGRACKYTNAGTVEFMVTPTGDFYFLEVNARLQVEHPVTEAVTGLDLVEWQIRCARGEKLPLSQDLIRFNGHAIQLRLYAEDPYEDYRPQTGKIDSFTFARGTRVDHFLIEGSEVTPFYDSMIAKIIVTAATRPHAIAEARRALDETLVSGPLTNQTFLRQILDSDFFKEGRAFTRTLDAWKFEKPAPEGRELAMALASAAEILYTGTCSPVSGFSNSRAHLSSAAWGSGKKAEVHRMRFEKDLGVSVFGGSREFRFENAKWDRPRLKVVFEGRPIEALIHRESSYTEVGLPGARFRFTNALNAASGLGSQADPDTVFAPMAGTINSVKIEKGSKVRAGETLAIVEAMKMQLELRAPRDGEVETVFIQAGSQVRQKQILLRLKSLS